MESPFLAQAPQSRIAKKTVIIAFLAVFVIAAVFAVSGTQVESTNLVSSEDSAKAWKEWKTKNAKGYGLAEEAIRYSSFVENMNIIDKHNHENHTYKLGLNKYSDLSNIEWGALTHGLKIPKDLASPSEFVASPSAGRSSGGTIVKPTLLATVDWRLNGSVNAIQDQGMCGSCWAHAATAVLEALAKAKTGTLPVLSRQQLVDCSGSYGNLGCNGGWCQSAFRYAMANGLAAESGYPYTALDGTCKPFTSVFKPTSYADIIPKDVTALKTALQTRPVIVYIEASAPTFQQYASGVYNDASCYSTGINHAVVVVGYTADAWIVRNSWSTYWGNGGYILISQANAASGGVCGILSNANTHPL